MRHVNLGLRRGVLCSEILKNETDFFLSSPIAKSNVKRRTRSDQYGGQTVSIIDGACGYRLALIYLYYSIHHL